MSMTQSEVQAVAVRADTVASNALAAAATATAEIALLKARVAELERSCCGDARQTSTK